MINLANNKPIKEATYLSTENSQRYRTIISIMFLKYEQMKYWMLKEEIYEIIKYVEGFENYTIDNLKQDLDSLERWGNLLTMQDVKKTRTIEEFKNRQFMYQISPVTIELQRTIIKIQNQKNIVRGSLEISLIERFRDTLKEIKTILNSNDENKYTDKKIFDWWDRLNIDFKHLNENYQDYVSEFYSPKSEQLFKTAEFLIFKESFIKYLREFIFGIQQNMTPIEEIIRSVKNEEITFIINKILSYSENNIAIGNDYDKEEAYDIHFGRFQSMKQWFSNQNGQKSMVSMLMDSTNEMINKITVYALQIANMNSFGNRKEEYKKILELFSDCREIEEAHKLSSVVFGAMNTKHIICDKERETESINSSIHDETPKVLITKPIIRNYREKTSSKVAIKNNVEKKKKILKEILESRKKERNLIESRIKDNRLLFSELENLTKEERDVFLSWLSIAINEKSDDWCKNQFGRYYKLRDRSPKNYITLRCIDGDFTMPNYELIFKEEI